MHNCTTYEEFQTELLLSVSKAFAIPQELLEGPSMLQNNLVLHLVDDTGEHRSKERIARMIDLIRLVVEDEGFDLAMSGDQDEMKKYIESLESPKDDSSS